MCISIIWRFRSHIFLILAALAKRQIMLMHWQLYLYYSTSNNDSIMVQHWCYSTGSVVDVTMPAAVSSLWRLYMHFSTVKSLFLTVPAIASPCQQHYSIGSSTSKDVGVMVSISYIDVISMYIVMPMPAQTMMLMPAVMHDTSVGNSAMILMLERCQQW